MLSLVVLLVMLFHLFLLFLLLLLFLLIFVPVIVVFVLTLVVFLTFVIVVAIAVTSTCICHSHPTSNRSPGHRSLVLKTKIIQRTASVQPCMHLTNTVVPLSRKRCQQNMLVLRQELFKKIILA